MWALISAYRAASLLDPHREPLDLPAARPGVTPERMADHDEALTWCETEYSVLMGAITTADSHRFDEAALDAWMQANVAGYAGPLEVRQFKGGQSTRPIS